VSSPAPSRARRTPSCRPAPSPATASPSEVRAATRSAGAEIILHFSSQVLGLTGFLCSPGGFGSYLLALDKKTYEAAGEDTAGNVPGSFKEPGIAWMTGFLLAVSFVGILALVPLRKVCVLTAPQIASVYLHKILNKGQILYPCCLHTVKVAFFLSLSFYPCLFLGYCFVLFVKDRLTD
jgi:hypothetical protein